MKKIFYPAVFFLLLVQQAFTQTKDSIDIYAGSVSDTMGINRLINYCFKHKNEQPEKCARFSQLALDQSKKINFKAGEARSVTNLGAIESVKGNYAAAVKYYFDAMNIWEALANKRGVMFTKNNIGEVYGNLRKSDLQLQYLTEALAIATENNFKDGEALAKQNLSIYYSSKNDFKKAFTSQLDAVLLFEQQNKLSEAALGYSNAGAYQFLSGHTDSALIYYFKAKDIGEKLKDVRVLSMSYANIAEAYENQNKIPEAIETYNKCIALSKPEKLKEQLLFCYGQLAGIYQKKEDYPEAIQFLKLQASVKDSILNITSAKQINELQEKYETEKKEHTIQQQQFEITKKNYWLAGGIVFFLLTVLLGISFYRSNKLKQAKKLQAEIMHQQDLATRAIIQAEENERKRIASDLHDGIGQTMSAAKMNLSSIESRLDFNNAEDKVAFEKIVNLVDESCKEVRNVSHNMMPNALLKSGLSSAVKEFIDKIDSRVLKVNLYSEGLNERLDSNVETVLYRVIQECVNNVIKHSGANELDISLIKDADGIAATIEDNGKGFAEAANLRSEGIGLKNIKTRIEYLKGTVDFDSAPGKGTLVAIHVPLNNG
ncbi:tetratricopeptide repeat-containing sensor histidine kinase [Ferruginibacter profundus]